MMKQYSRALIVAVALLMAASLAWAAQNQSPPAPTPVQGLKETINPADLPQAVRQAIANTAPEDSPVSATKINRDGKIGYLVVITGVRGKREILVTEDGKVIKRDIKPDDQPETKAQAIKENINLADIPPVVLEAVRQHTANQTIESARRITRDGQIDYLVVLNGAGGKRAILVSENGKVLKKDVKPDDQSPAPDSRATKKIEKARDRSDRKIEKTKDRAADKKNEGNNK